MDLPIKSGFSRCNEPVLTDNIRKRKACKFFSSVGILFQAFQGRPCFASLIANRTIKEAAKFKPTNHLLSFCWLLRHCKLRLSRGKKKEKKEEKKKTPELKLESESPPRKGNPIGKWV